jgi:hypothetical protein
MDAADEASEAVADSAAEAARVTILPDTSERLADRTAAAPEDPKAPNVRPEDSAADLGLVAPAWTEIVKAGARVLDLPLDRDPVNEMDRVVARTAVRERLATPVNATDNAVESAALRTASLVATVAREAAHDSAALLGLEAPPIETCKRPSGRVAEAARITTRPDETVSDPEIEPEARRVRWAAEDNDRAEDSADVRGRRPPADATRVAVVAGAAETPRLATPEATMVAAAESAAVRGRRAPAVEVMLAVVARAAERGRKAWAEAVRPAAIERAEVRKRVRIATPSRLAVAENAAVLGRRPPPEPARLAAMEMAAVRGRNPPPEADRLAVVASVAVLAQITDAACVVDSDADNVTVAGHELASASANSISANVTIACVGGITCGYRTSVLPIESRAVAVEQAQFWLAVALTVFHWALQLMVLASVPPSASAV